MEKLQTKNQDSSAELSAEQQSRYQQLKAELSQAVERLAQLDKEYGDFKAYWGRSQYWLPLMRAGMALKKARKNLARFKEETGYEEPEESVDAMAVVAAQAREAKDADYWATKAEKHAGRKLFLSDHLTSALGRETSFGRDAKKKRKEAEQAKQTAGEFVTEHLDQVEPAARAEMEQRTNQRGHNKAA